MSKAFTGLMRKRTLFATLLALTIFGAVYGFAATLSVNTNDLSAGNATVASCQTGTPSSTYGISYDSTLGGYAVSSVTVTGLSSACAGKTVAVTLTDGSNASLASGNTAIPTGGGSATISSLSGTAAASSVAGVQVAING